ncbi:MAG: hypothetical protein QG570_598 [Patescibacteria group bacterium]|nr:hypothetical protein [Patescibacteria group bacterium]
MLNQSINEESLILAKRRIDFVSMRPIGKPELDAVDSINLSPDGNSSSSTSVRPFAKLKGLNADCTYNIPVVGLCKEWTANITFRQYKRLTILGV